MKKSIVAVLLCMCLLMSVVVPIYAEGSGDGELVTVTVNFINFSNKSMVSQPYGAQIAKGAAFKENIITPKIANYYTPLELIEGLNSDITFSMDGEGCGIVSFDLDEVTENIVVNVYYVAGKATYTVKHYYQNVEDNSYGEPEIVQLIGDIDAYTEAVVNSRQGFICCGVPKYIIAADGTTTVEIYYDRLYYTIVFDANGGVNGPKPIFAKYGTTYSMPDVSKIYRSGYVFAGWNVTPSCKVESDVTYVANWLPSVNNTNLTIVFWGQNANDDEYSYISSATGHGAPEQVMTYSADAYICEGAHTHTASCYIMTCEMENHTHDKCNLNCKHVHTAACYGATSAGSTTVPGDWDSSYDTKTFMNDLGLQSGCVYYYDDGAWGGDDHYILYFDGLYYDLTESQYDEIKTGNALATKNYSYSSLFAAKDSASKYAAKISKCTHTMHDDSCYDCGKIAHTHSAIGGSCYTVTCGYTEHTHTSACKRMSSVAPDSNLWTFDHSDTVTISADEKTVLNVYFRRNEFTLTFKSGTGSSATTYGTIKDRWGANISERYNAMCALSGYIAWCPSGTDHFTNYIGIMPQQSDTYSKYSMSSGTQVMTYYGKDLNGNDEVMFTLKANFREATVTVEDMYEFEGFTINRSRSTKTGSNMSGAKFYYDRNSYNLEFYSENNYTCNKTVSVLYEDNIGKYDYTPTVQPVGLEAGAVFYGWYLNPQCSGERYNLSTHTMPASNMALYARWVNGLFDVTTYTDSSMNSYYSYEGYSGIQKDVIKYENAIAPIDPTKPGEYFVGWFYLDETGKEQPFSFTMPITQNYKIYPKFSNRAVVSYTVHYYLAGTTTKLADDAVFTNTIGVNVTEKAKVGTQLNLVGDRYNRYFPEKASTSMTLTEKDMELIFYYHEAESLPYTVRYVVQSGTTRLGEPIYTDLVSPKVVRNNMYSVVTESYVTIPDYVPEYYQLTMPLVWSSTGSPDDNVMYFVYTGSLTTMTVNKTCSDSNMAPGTTFLFRIKGAEAGTQNIDMTVSIQGTGSVKISDLPIGVYTVTELTGWSWRYTPDEASKSVTASGQGVTVEFSNTKTNTSPVLDANAFVRNIFG